MRNRKKGGGNGVIEGGIKGREKGMGREMERGGKLY